MKIDITWNGDGRFYTVTMLYDDDSSRVFNLEEDHMHKLQEAIMRVKSTSHDFDKYYEEEPK